MKCHFDKTLEDKFNASMTLEFPEEEYNMNLPEFYNHYHMPVNTLPSNLSLCLDPRKNNCIYYRRIKYEDKYIGFDVSLCLYNFKKKNFKDSELPFGDT